MDIMLSMLTQTELQCTYSAGLFGNCLQSAVPGLQGHCITLQYRFSAPRHCAKRTLQCLFRQSGSRSTAKCSAALQGHCKLRCHCSAALQGHCSLTCSALSVPVNQEVPIFKNDNQALQRHCKVKGQRDCHGTAFLRCICSAYCTFCSAYAVPCKCTAGTLELVTLQLDCTATT